jgi:hypothetical protein
MSFLPPETFPVREPESAATKIKNKKMKRGGMYKRRPSI